MTVWTQNDHIPVHISNSPADAVPITRSLVPPTMIARLRTRSSEKRITLTATPFAIHNVLPILSMPPAKHSPLALTVSVNVLESYRTRTALNPAHGSIQCRHLRSSAGAMKLDAGRFGGHNSSEGAGAPIPRFGFFLLARSDVAARLPPGLLALCLVAELLQEHRAGPRATRESPLACPPGAKAAAFPEHECKVAPESLPRSIFEMGRRTRWPVRCQPTRPPLAEGAYGYRPALSRGSTSLTTLYHTGISLPNPRSNVEQNS